MKCHGSAVEVGWSKTACFNSLKQKICPPFFLKIVSSQANTRNMFFKQKSPRHPKVGVSRWHRQTDKHTHGHGDSMTNSAQWGRVGEKTKKHFSHMVLGLRWSLFWRTTPEQFTEMVMSKDLFIGFKCCYTNSIIM